MRLHRIDIPIWDVMGIVFRKPSIAEFKERTSKLLLSESGFKRAQFLNRYYIAPLAKKGVVLGSLIYIAYEMMLSLPPYHNSKLEQAYKKRYERHLQYLKEKPEYKKALLDGYKMLAPPS